MKHLDRGIEEKVSYCKPQLIMYGSISELTAGPMFGTHDVPVGNPS